MKANGMMTMWLLSIVACETVTAQVEETVVVEVASEVYEAGSDLSDGVFDVGEWLLRDGYDLLVGTVVGKPTAVYRALDGQGLSPMRDTVLAIIIPTHGNALGAMWGIGENYDDTTRFSGTSKSQLFHCSAKHDQSCYDRLVRGESMSAAHLEWVRGAWFGPGTQPGPTGQVVRLLGTVAFGLAGGLNLD